MEQWHYNIYNEESATSKIKAILVIQSIAIFMCTTFFNRLAQLKNNNGNDENLQFYYGKVNMIEGYSMLMSSK